MSEQFTLFWGERPFSQWSPSTFTVDDATYNCAEQYMMAMKAKVFGDAEKLQEIMKAEHPADQKRLGRQVRGFEATRWEKIAREVVYKGNYEKFKQNADMREKLFATAGTTLVEASPKDRIWGIGMGAKNPDAQDRAKWQGRNWLGEVLTRVRDDLLREKEDALSRNKDASS